MQNVFLGGCTCNMWCTTPDVLAFDVMLSKREEEEEEFYKLRPANRTDQSWQ